MGALVFVCKEISKREKVKLFLGTFIADFSQDAIDPMVEGMIKINYIGI